MWGGARWVGVGLEIFADVKVVLPTRKSICDMIKGNESLVENFNSYFLITSMCFILIPTP